jgi:Protein of unknown function (DUF2442)
MNPRVKKVKAEPDYHLRLTFDNGEIRLFDMKPYLSVGVFRKLKDPASFRSVLAALGTIRWKGGQDLCPDTLYEESVPASKSGLAMVAHEKQAFYKVRPRVRAKNQ